MQKLSKLLPEYVWEQRPTDIALDEWTGDSFEKRLPLLFISAMGIAVRTVAPYVRDKLSDSPVIVADEKGLHIIPVLSVILK